MNAATLQYEAPSMIEVGDFTDLTRATCCGYWVDFFGGWWF